MIPYFVQDAYCKEIGPNLKECIASGDIGPGRYVRMLEEKACELSGKKYAVATVSGTVALYLALKFWGSNKDRFFSLPSYGHVAAVNAAIAAWMGYGFRDMRKDALEDEYENVNSKSNVIVWHGGILKNRSHILRNLKSKGRLCIEDAACAFGEPLPGHVIGAVWSLSGPKIISAGQGGILLTDETALAKDARAYCDQGVGFRSEGTVIKPGTNMRLSNISAAYALDQCEFLNERWDLRKEAIAIFENGVPEGAAYYGGLHNILYYQTQAEALRAKAALEHSGIESQQPYRALHNHHAFRKDWPFDGAVAWEKQSLYLPFGPGLTPEMADRICEVLNS